MNAPNLPVHRLAWALAAVLAHGPAQAADTRLGLLTDINFDSNVNRSANDKREDTFAALEGYAARSLPTGARSGLVLRATVRGREYFAFSDLSNLGLAGRAAWRFQPHGGYTSPWVELALQGEALRFRDSPIRDGGILSAGLSTGRWFSDRLRGAAGAAYEHRHATTGTLYDLATTKAWASLDWRCNDTLTAYGSGTLTGGQQVFTALSSRAAGMGWSPASFGGQYAASARDPAFDSVNERFTGYRADARATVLELGIHWAFASQHALDLGFAHHRAKADGGPAYDGYTLRAGWLYQFR